MVLDWRAEANGNFERLVRALNEEPGIMIIGSGLSIPAGFPDWPKLCGLAKDFAEAHGTDTSELPPEPAPGKLPEYLSGIKRRVGEDAFLVFLRETFERPVTTVPFNYETIAQIPNIAVISTLNFDECLATLSTHHSLRLGWYPTLRYPIGEPACLYLHGRAKTARVSGDLVVTPDDYAMAYGFSSELHGVLRHILQRAPAVFVGTSLEDGVLNQLLLQIQQAAVTASRSGTLFPAPELFVFAEVSEKTLPGDRLHLEANHVRPIWFDPKNDYRELSLLLEELVFRAKGPRGMTFEEPDTLWSANVAGRLARTNDPSPQEVERAKVILDHETSATAFFAASPDGSWLAPLSDAGVLLPVEPKETSDGGWQSPRWEAGTWLEKLAGTERAPEVAGFVASLRTDNWIALHHLGEILAALPPAEALTLTGPLKEWLDGPFRLSSLLPASAVKALSNALHDPVFQHSDSVQPLAAAIITFFGSENGADLLQRSNSKKFVDEHFSDLAVNFPESTFELVIGLLETVVEKRWPDPSADGSWMARPSIAPHDQNRHDDNLDFLLDCARTSLEVLRNHDAYFRLIESLFESARPLLIRLALHEICAIKPALDHLTEKLANRLPTLLDDMNVYHELAILFHTRNDIPASVTEEFQDALDRLERENSRNRWLVVSADENLSTSQIQERSAEIEFSESMLFPFYMEFGRATWMKPPMTQEEFDSLAALEDPANVVEIARNPRDYTDAIEWDVDSELVWKQFATRAEETGSLDSLLAVTSSDLSAHEQAYRIPEAAAKIAGPDATKWDLVLDWLAQFIDADGNQPQLAAQALKLAVNPEAPLSATERAVDLASNILANTCSPLDEEISEGAVHRSDGRMDLATDYLNSPAGAAAEVLYQAAFRTLRGPAGSVRTRAPWATKAVELAVAEDWGGREFRLALGSMLPLLVSAHGDRIETLLPGLLPDNGSIRARNSRAAFWTGYTWRTKDVYQGTLDVLLPYVRAEQSRAEEDELLDSDLRQQLVAQIVIAAVNGDDNYRDLMHSTLQLNQRARRRVIDAFAQLLPSQESTDSVDETSREEALQFAAQHLESHGQSEEEAWGSYARWFPNLVNTPFEDMRDLVLRVATSQDLEWEINILLEHLLFRAKDDPEAVVEITGQLLDVHLGRQELGWHGRDLEQLLRLLADASVSPKLREIVRRVFTEGLIGKPAANEILGLEAD